MNIIFGILVGIVVMTIVVTIHEFGHFIAARRSGVTVKEFGIGFPPKAIAWLHVPRDEVKKYCKKFGYSEKKSEKILKKLERYPKKQWFFIPLPKSEWYEEIDGSVSMKSQDYLIFSLNWLPIGGFCQMDGENNSDRRKGTFGAASLWQKTKILFAGVTMNWLLAIVILTGLAATSGIPEILEHQFYLENDTKIDNSSLSILVSDVIKDTPAEKGGIKGSDILLEGKYEDETVEFNSVSSLQEFNKNHAGKPVTYKVLRDNKEETISVKLNDTSSEYLLGISMGQMGIKKFKMTWSAPITATVNTLQFTGETFRGLGDLVVNVFSGITSQFSSNEAVKNAGKQKIEAAGDAVAGPVGIIGVLFPQVAESGLAEVLLLAAIISISLACMNVLPIPALDGGRWLLIIIFEKILRRKLTPETENKIVSRAFVTLLILAALITVLDVIKIIR